MLSCWWVGVLTILPSWSPASLPEILWLQLSFVQLVLSLFLIFFWICDDVTLLLTYAECSLRPYVSYEPTDKGFLQLKSFHWIERYQHIHVLSPGVAIQLVSKQAGLEVRHSGFMIKQGPCWTRKLQQKMWCPKSWGQMSPGKMVPGHLFQMTGIILLLWT